MHETFWTDREDKNISIDSRFYVEVKCMFINFIAFVVCAIVGIWQIYLGNVGLFLVEITLALINLPLAIKWLKEYFAD